MSDLHFWGECKKTLERDLTVEEYSTWIAPLMLEENNGSNPLSYSVLAPNKFISDWVEDNYGSTIKERLSAICLLYTSPSPRDQRGSRMPSSA